MKKWFRTEEQDFPEERKNFFVKVEANSGSSSSGSIEDYSLSMFAKLYTYNWKFIIAASSNFTSVIKNVPWMRITKAIWPYLELTLNLRLEL